MPTSVLLMTFDALGYEALEQNIERLPNLRLLRDHSVVFRNAFSVGPSTFFSFPAIMGSVYPFHLGVGIHDGVTTIDELLKLRGYNTAQINEANALISPYYGYSRGTDYQQHFLQLSHAAVDHKLYKTFLSAANTDERRQTPRVPRLLTQLGTQVGKTPLGQLVRRCAKGIYFLRLCLAGHSSESFDQRARLYSAFRGEILSFIQNVFTPPQFLFVHTIVNHLPYFPSKGSSSFSKRKMDYLNFRGLSDLVDHRISQQLRTLYVESMQTTDELIHDTMEVLRSSNRLDDTLIIVSADHGEEFMEDAFFGHSTASSSDRLLHVPLMFYCPQLLEPRNIQAPVSLIDILPTVCDLLGYDIPDSARGISLTQLMSSYSQGSAVAQNFWERPIFSEAWQTDGLLDRKPGIASREKFFTVRKHNYKLAVTLAKKGRGQTSVTQDLRLSDWMTDTPLDAASNGQIINELLADLHDHSQAEEAFANSLRRRLETQRLGNTIAAIRKATGV